MNRHNPNDFFSSVLKRVILHSNRTEDSWLRNDDIMPIC